MQPWLYAFVTQPNQKAMIANEHLRAAFLDEPMLCYFKSKLPELPDHELLARIEETLKFLYIASECTGPIPVSRDIDEIWHYWILQTKEYASLCELLPTGTVIHHSSNEYLRYFDQTIGQSSDLALDVKMLALYVGNFGPFETGRTHYWLLATHLVQRCGWTTQQLNDWLQTTAPDEAESAVDTGKLQDATCVKAANTEPPLVRRPDRSVALSGSL
jgi:hypothetical protein